MSGLQNFLAPFSHLLFANRNLVIFLLCLFLFLAALDALIHRWKTQRLHQDLKAARSGGAYGSSGRRYSGASAGPEAASEPGGALPPVKGGRTYARNLGSALQKAGMSTPQIYSPPTPPGWAANTNPGQPPQPGMPYASPTTPWGAPAAPATPWAFQSGAGRSAPAPSASPVPFYQPQPSAPQSQPGMPQPSTPSGPGLYSPPSPAPAVYSPPPAPFGQPPFPIPASGSPAPAPSFAPPGAPSSPMMPAFPAPALPAAEPAAPEGGRRGKPKRRRFNFNVLENLEKLVQPKSAEPLASTSWTPPPAASAAPAAPPEAGLQPPATTAPSTPAAAEPAFPVTSTGPEAPSLPLQFGGPADTNTAPAAEPAVEQPIIDFGAPATEEKAPEAEASGPEHPASVIEPEPATEPEPKPDARRSMRSMMFGEEVAAPEAQAAEESESVPAPETSAAADRETSSAADAETSSVSAEPSWPSSPWSRREEASSSADEAATPESSTGGESMAEESREAEPVGESPASDGFDPWTPSFTPEPESTTEPVATESEPIPSAEAAEATTGQVPDEPVATDRRKPGAGTLVIIEDDPTAASYYATLFRGNGYHVEVANDGVSGVDLATRVKPQVILLDVMMPRQNGILVLQTLRASDETKNTPVVVMSNFSEPTLIKRALQLGALEYVIKTQVEGPALLNALPRWMNREKAFAAA